MINLRRSCSKWVALTTERAPQRGIGSEWNSVPRNRKTHQKLEYVIYGHTHSKFMDQFQFEHSWLVAPFGGFGVSIKILPKNEWFGATKRLGNPDLKFMVGRIHLIVVGQLNDKQTQTNAEWVTPWLTLLFLVSILHKIFYCCTYYYLYSCNTPDLCHYSYS